ncbi:hypothetical protein EDD21DRAFT_390372 [Dissophora ornata]|nr:hypothetical protein EDD21DRAFT_390372 [Dissophora ornata]
MSQTHLDWAMEEREKEHVYFANFVAHFELTDRESTTAAFQALLQSSRISLKRREVLNDEFDKFRKHHEGQFWTTRALRLNSKNRSQELAIEAQNTATDEASAAFAHRRKEIAASSRADPLSNESIADSDQISTTPIASPSLSPLRVTGPRLHQTKDNTLTLQDLSTDASALNSADDAPSAKLSTVAATVVEPPNNSEAADTSDETANTSDETADTSDEAAYNSSESEELLEREREELLRSVDESDHPSCDWEIDGNCAACRFMDYRRTCINALTAREIKKTDIADILAIIGVFAPSLPTSRMHEFFSAEQLKAISRPEPDLPDININDEMIMKAVRLYLKRKGSEAEVPSVGGNKKIRIMLETLLEYLPLKTNNKVSESTFTVKYVGPIIQAYIDCDEVTSDFPNTNSTTQTQQNMKADRPDIRAKAMEREIMWGEVTGPIQARSNVKNVWDTLKLARYGKAFIIAGNDFAPLVQVIDNQGSYMRLYLKTRGVMILEEIGTFVIPTRKEMVPALVATLPTLELLKEHVKELSNNRKINQLKRSWGHRDNEILKKRLL